MITFSQPWVSHHFIDFISQFHPIFSTSSPWDAILQLLQARSISWSTPIASSSVPCFDIPAEFRQAKLDKLDPDSDAFSACLKKMS